MPRCRPNGTGNEESQSQSQSRLPVNSIYGYYRLAVSYYELFTASNLFFADVFPLLFKFSIYHFTASILLSLARSSGVNRESVNCEDSDSRLTSTDR